MVRFNFLLILAILLPTLLPLMPSQAAEVATKDDAELFIDRLDRCADYWSPNPPIDDENREERLKAAADYNCAALACDYIALKKKYKKTDTFDGINIRQGLDEVMDLLVPEGSSIYTACKSK